MVTRSHLVSLAGLGLLTAALVVSAAFVKNPDSRTRIFNLAREIEEGVSSADCKASGGSYDSRTKNCTFTPGQSKKAEEKAKKKPKKAKNAGDCAADEFYLKETKTCYPVGSEVQEGYTVCQDDSHGGQTYICDVPLPAPPPPGPDGTVTEPPKYCTFKSGSGQYVTIPPGESVAGGGAYDNPTDPEQRTAVRVCDPKTGELTECTTELIADHPQLGNCSVPTIAPGGSEYAETSGANCNSGGLLLPNNRVFNGQQCQDGKLVASPLDPDEVSNFLLNGGPPPEGLILLCANDAQANPTGSISCPDPAAFAATWLAGADPGTLQTVQEIKEMGVLYGLVTAPDQTAWIAPTDTEVLQFCADNNIDNPNPNISGCTGMTVTDVLGSYCQNSGGADCNFPREFGIDQLTAYNPESGQQAQTAAKQNDAANYALKTQLEQELAAPPPEHTLFGLDRPQATVFDAGGQPVTIDAGIDNLDITSLGTVAGFPGLSTQPPTACGGALQACCRAGFGTQVSFNSDNHNPCNTGFACGTSGKCEYNTALAQANAITRLAEADPENAATIIDLNVQAYPQAAGELNQAFTETKQQDCATAWTYSDTEKEYICPAARLAADPDHPDTGNLNQPCRWNWGSLSNICNDSLLACQAGNCVLTEESKHFLAAQSSSTDPAIVAQNLATVNSPGQALALDPELAEAGCVNDRSAYRQNGQTWICADAASQTNFLAPSDDYYTHPELVAALFADVKNSVPTTKTTQLDVNGNYIDIETCPENLIKIEHSCVDPKVAAFDENYQQGVVAASMRDNLFNDVPVVNWVVDHVVAPVFAAIPGSSYYTAAKTQAEVARTMLETSDAPLEQVLSTISPNAQVFLHINTINEFDANEVTNYNQMRNWYAANILYKPLAYISLFTGAWTEDSGAAIGQVFSGGELDQNQAFLNYAQSFSGADVSSPGTYFSSYGEDLGQKLAGSAGFGIEITFVAADLLPVGKISEALVFPQMAQKAFEKSAAGKISTGIMEVVAAPMLVFTPSNIRPATIFAHGVDLIKQGLGGNIAGEAGQKAATELVQQGLQEVPEAAVKKLTATLPNGHTVTVADDAIAAADGDITYLIGRTSGGSTYLIDPATGDSFLVDGSSGLLTRLSEATDKFIHDVFPGLAKSYDGQFDEAIEALTKQTAGKPEGWLTDAGRVRALTDAGYPPYLIDADLLDELDNALAKAGPAPPAGGGTNQINIPLTKRGDPINNNVLYNNNDDLPFTLIYDPADDSFLIRYFDDAKNRPITRQVTSNIIDHNGEKFVLTISANEPKIAKIIAGEAPAAMPLPHAAIPAPPAAAIPPEPNLTNNAAKIAKDNSYQLQTIDAGNLTERIDLDADGVGIGSQGEVYKTTVNGQPAAVKIYFTAGESDESLLKMLAEETSNTQLAREILGDSSVDFLGIVTTSDGRIGLAVQLAPRTGAVTQKTIDDLFRIQTKLHDAGYYIRIPEFGTAADGSIVLYDLWQLEKIDNPEMIAYLAREFGLPETEILKDPLLYAAKSQLYKDFVYSLENTASEFAERLKTVNAGTPAPAPNWFQRNIRADDGTWFPTLRRPAAATPNTIPIGREIQPGLFEGNRGISRQQGVVEIDPRGRAIYKDTGSTHGTTYRIGDNGEFIEVPKNGVVLTNNTQLHFNNSGVTAAVSIDENGIITLFDVDWGMWHNTVLQRGPIDITEFADEDAAWRYIETIPERTNITIPTDPLDRAGFLQNVRINNRLLELKRPLTPEEIFNLANSHAELTGIPIEQAIAEVERLDSLLRVAEAGREATFDIVDGALQITKADGSIQKLSLGAPAAAAIPPTWWQKIKKPVIITTDIIVGGSIVWSARDWIITNIITPTFNWFYYLFNPAPTGTAPPEPGTVTPTPTQTQPTQLPPGVTPTEMAEFAKNLWPNLPGALTQDLTPNEQIAMAAYIAQKIVEYIQTPGVCIDDTPECQQAFGQYLEAQIKAEYPQLWSGSTYNDFTYYFDQFIPVFGRTQTYGGLEQIQPINSIIWLTILEGIPGLNLPEISGYPFCLGSGCTQQCSGCARQFDVFDLVAGDETNSKRPNFYDMIFTYNNTQDMNLKYNAGANTAYRFTDYDYITPGMVGFYGDHDFAVLEVYTDPNSGERLFVISEANSPKWNTNTAGVPTGIPAVYVVSETEFAKYLNPLGTTVFLVDHDQDINLNNPQNELVPYNAPPVPPEVLANRQSD